MTDTKLLQAILDKVSSMDKQLDKVDQRLDKVDQQLNQMDKKMDKGFKEIYQKIDSTEKKLTHRIDKLGLQLANLEDDAPTREEFDDLDSRVLKLERKIPQ